MTVEPSGPASTDGCVWPQSQWPGVWGPEPGGMGWGQNRHGQSVCEISVRLTSVLWFLICKKEVIKRALTSWVSSEDSATQKAQNNTWPVTHSM